MADFVCGTCGAEAEYFFHHIPDSVLCEQNGCAGTCERRFSLPGEWRPTNAARFEPIVIHRSPNGKLRFPGSVDAIPPRGFEKVELRTIQEADKFVAGMNAREQARINEHFYRKEEALGHQLKKNRDELKSELRRRGLPGYIAELGRRYTEQKRTAMSSQSRSANCHFEVFAFDRSNREPHSDVRTGWQDRRV